MKIEVIDFNTEVDIGFEGVCLDIDGGMWLFGMAGACLFRKDDSAIFYTTKEVEQIFEDYGPFTVFTGSLTISN